MWSLYTPQIIVEEVYISVVIMGRKITDIAAFTLRNDLLST